MHHDEQAVREVIAGWQAATAEGDVERLSAMVDEDVVFLTPSRQPMLGKEAFIHAVREGIDRYRIEHHGEIRELRISHDVAYCWSQLHVTVTPHGGLPMRRSGSTLSILRKRPDAQWVIVHDANMLTSEPAKVG